MMLIDQERGLVYIECSEVLLNEWRDNWTEPLQIKFESGQLVLRPLDQPVKGVYIVPKQHEGFGTSAAPDFRRGTAGL